MKKLIIMILVLSTVLSLASCGNKSPEATTPAETTVAPAPEATPAPEITPEPEGETPGDNQLSSETLARYKNIIAELKAMVKNN